jgi:predicted DsbA family dithiol-disulfide isomerase
MVFIDVIRLWCYVGKRRMEKARDVGHEHALRVSWLFELNPDMPKEGMERREYACANSDHGAFAGA